MEGLLPRLHHLWWIEIESLLMEFVEYHEVRYHRHPNDREILCFKLKRYETLRSQVELLLSEVRYL